MIISKRSLRWLPVFLLLEMLSPAVTLAAMLPAYLLKTSVSESAAAAAVLLVGMAVVAVWITGTVLLYGVMELSRFFTYAWYLQLIYFVIRAVSLVLDGFSSANNGAGAETVSALSDMLSAGQQFIGILSHSMILFGARSVMKKANQGKYGSKCRVYAVIYIAAGLLMLLSDAAGYMLGGSELFSAAKVAAAAVDIFLTVLTSAVAVPAFFAVRKTFMTVYKMLFNAQEG